MPPGMNRRAPSPAFRHQAREGGGTVTTNGKIEVFGALDAVLKDYQSPLNRRCPHSPRFRALAPFGRRCTGVYAPHLAGIRKTCTGTDTATFQKHPKRVYPDARATAERNERRRKAMDSHWRNFP